MGRKRHFGPLRASRMVGAIPGYLVNGFGYHEDEICARCDRRVRVRQLGIRFLLACSCAVIGSAEVFEPREERFAAPIRRS